MNSQKKKEFIKESVDKLKNKTEEFSDSIIFSSSRKQ